MKYKEIIYGIYAFLNTTEQQFIMDDLDYVIDNIKIVEDFKYTSNIDIFKYDENKETIASKLESQY